MLSLESAFKLYGKKKMVAFLNGEVSSRIHSGMSVDKIIYVLDVYGERVFAEKRLDELRKDSPNGHLYLGNNYKMWE